MKVYVVFLILLVSQIRTYAEEPTDRFGVPWCIDRTVSSDSNQIRCLQSLDETEIVRKGLVSILQQARNCPTCKSSIVDGEKYRFFFRFPLLITSAFLSTRGTGTIVHFIFKDGPLREFEAYLVVNDGNVNEFRLLDVVPHSRNTARLIRKLRTNKFAHFWINP